MGAQHEGAKGKERGKWGCVVAEKRHLDSSKKDQREKGRLVLKGLRASFLWWFQGEERKGRGRAAEKPEGGFKLC